MKNVTRQLHIVENTEQKPLLKIAFATSDRETVNQHFGSAKSISMYGVGPTDFQLLTVTEFGDLVQDGNEDKLGIKIDTLKDCAAVYCRACGASAVRQLLKSGVQPVKVSEGTSIVALISALQKELKDGPSQWLSKALQHRQTKNTDRFDAMESEGWSE